MAYGEGTVSTSFITWLKRYSRMLGDATKTIKATVPMIAANMIVIIFGPTRSAPMPAMVAPTGTKPDRKLMIPVTLPRNAPGIESCSKVMLVVIKIISKNPANAKHTNAIHSSVLIAKAINDRLRSKSDAS